MEDPRSLSDRILRIEIVSDSFDSKSNYETCDCVYNKKHRRKNLSKENGDEAEATDDSECSTVAKIKTLHISSIILARQSPFFNKLFENGMRESGQWEVTMRINSYEEAAFKDLLRFMYTDTVNATTTSDLLGVLIVADKFEVTSCMTYCSQLLQGIPMSLESALLYLNLPSTVSTNEVVQPLIDEALHYLMKHCTDITKSQTETMALPLYALEVVLSSDGFRVTSEDALYDFILKWARSHYSNLEERREILTKRLVRFIRFSNLSDEKLKEVLACPFFEQEEVTNLVLEAFFSKIGSYGQGTTGGCIVERVYKYRPIKVVHEDSPLPSCDVYFNLKKKECANLFPSERLDSQPFSLGGQMFFVSAQCNKGYFGLFVGMQDKGSLIFAFDYEFAVWRNPKDGFEGKYKSNCTFNEGKLEGNPNLFEIPWSVFMSDNCEYFINGILYLQVQLSIKQLVPRLLG